MKRIIKSLLCFALLLSMLLEPVSYFAAEGSVFRSQVSNITGQNPGGGKLKEGDINVASFVEVQICRTPTAKYKHFDEIHDYAKNVTAFAANERYHNTVASNETHCYGYGENGASSYYTETASMLWCINYGVYSGVPGNRQFWDNQGLGDEARKLAYEIWHSDKDSPILTDEGLRRVAICLNKAGSMYCPDEYLDDINNYIDNSVPPIEREYCYWISFEMFMVPCYCVDEAEWYLLTNANASSGSIGTSRNGMLFPYNMSAFDKLEVQPENYVFSGDSTLYDTYWPIAEEYLLENQEIYDDHDLLLYRKTFWGLLAVSTWFDDSGLYPQKYVEPTVTEHFTDMIYQVDSSNHSRIGCGYWGMIGEGPIEYHPTIHWAVESKTQGASTDYQDNYPNEGKVNFYFRPMDTKTFEYIETCDVETWNITITASSPYNGTGEVDLYKASNNYWAGNGGAIENSDTFRDVKIDTASNKLTCYVYNDGLIKMLTGERILTQHWRGSDLVYDVKTDTEISGKHDIQWEVKIEPRTGTSSQPVYVQSSSGKHPYEDTRENWNFNGWISNGTKGVNYISWIQKLSDKIPWEWQSNSGGGAYAEVVANTLTNLQQDWSVMGGLPSSENLCVAVGGTSFAVDLAGNIESVGRETGSAASPSVTREIKFVVNINNIWGEESDGNPRCELSCPGHQYTVYGETYTGTSTGCTGTWTCEACRTVYRYANGDNKEGDTCNENDHSDCYHGTEVGGVSNLKKCKTTKEWSCWQGGRCINPGKCPGTNCNDTANPCECMLACTAACPCGGANPTCQGACHRTEEHHTHHTKACAINGQDCKVGYKVKCKCDKTHTNNYECPNHNSVQLEYHCDTGNWYGEGEVPTSNLTVTSTKDSTGQRYNSTVKWKSQYNSTLSGESGEVTHTNSDVICQGYTEGTGCFVTHQMSNCVHPKKFTKEFIITETLDKYAWRSITAAKVYMLTHATITGINSNLLESTAKGDSCTNAGLITDIWRGNGGWKSGNKGQNGRLWFTQFKDPFAEKAEFGTGAKVTSVQGYDANGNLCNTYWLSDCIITIDAYADTRVGKMANPYVAKKIDSSTDGSGVSEYEGRDLNHYKNETTKNSIVEEYKQNKGDWLSTNDATVQAFHVVNAWIWCNKSDDYTVNVVSDSLFVGIDGGVGGASVAQDVCADVYAVDTGITMFQNGFGQQGWNETFKFEHTSQYADPVAIFQSNESNHSSIFTSNSPFMFQGYLGTPARDNNDKYGVTGNNVSLNNALVYALSKSSGGLSKFENKNDVNWSAGDSIATASSGSSPYARIISEATTDSPGRVGIRKLTTSTNSSTTETHKGHYGEFQYTKGSYNVFLQGIEGSYKSDVFATCDNSGQVGLAQYDVPLHMDNLDIKNNIPNGVYENPVTVSTSFAEAYKLEGEHFEKLPNRTFGYRAPYTSSYKNRYTNDVVIHDPISVEYCQLIPNNYGALISIYNVDESKEDMRLSTEGISNANKNDYVVIGNKFYIWSSDLGDFKQDAGWEVWNASSKLGVGSNTQGSNKMDGSIQSAEGYTNMMNTSQYINKRYVSFTFPVSYINTSGSKVTVQPGTEIDLSKVKQEGSAGYGSNELQSFRGTVNDVEDMEFVYGKMYAFTVLEPSTEGDNTVTFKTVAKNKPATDNNASLDKNDARYSLAANHTVTKTLPVEIVGRIGNLAIEDTTDFRFSNLFKKPTSEWLIEGVVKKVDTTTPSNIVSTIFDILGKNATSIKHGTYSVTTYPKGSSGKSGDYLKLPLSSSLNNLKEFKGQELRLGYQLYMDIETLGQYAGYNYKVVNNNEVNDRGPISTDDTVDNRTNKLVIKPRYVLYDLDTNKFEDIDLYAGSVGSYSKVYAATGEVIRNSVASLYIDLENERERRNTSPAEYTTTRNVTKQHGALMVRDALTEKDFIGTASEIVLDAYDRTYIGSTVLNGKFTGGSYNPPTSEASDYYSINISSSGGSNLGTNSQFISNSGTLQNKLSDVSFSNASQRYYFTMGLPSSTIMTYPGAGVNQNAIVDSYRQIKEEHPNSVILVLADIKAYGEVYTLHYDVNQVMGSTLITTPENETIDYTDPSRQDLDGGDPLDEYDVPLFFMDPWNSSTTDLEVYGTH